MNYNHYHSEQELKAKSKASTCICEANHNDAMSPNTKPYWLSIDYFKMELALDEFVAGRAPLLIL